MRARNQVSTVENKSQKDRESDIDYALQYTRFFLSCIGIWPLVSLHPTRIEKIVSKFLTSYCIITMISIILPICLHLTLRDVGTIEAILLLGPLCFSSSNILKYFIVIFHSDLIKYCIQQMDNDWRRIENQNDRDIAVHNLRIGRSLSFMSAVLIYLSGVFYVILKPLYMGNTINELNETVRPLVYPGNDIIIDLQAGFNYEIIFCNNCIAAFMHYTVVNVIFNLASSFVTHACGQIQITLSTLVFELSWVINGGKLDAFWIIMSRLEKLVEEGDAITINNRIAFITRRHVSVLRFSSTIDILLREICLVEVVVSTIVICMLEYYCLLEWRNGNKLSVITYGILLVGVIFNIFIYCYVGELLKKQCEDIGKAAYMIEWYRLPGKTGLDLIMIIITSSKSRRLTAGRVVELSMATFCNVLKSSFAYLGILKVVAVE